MNENLAKRHFASDRYRVVYFCKYVELIPVLPLNISIFAEDDQAIRVAEHPRMLKDLFPGPDLKPVFERWGKTWKRL